MPKNSKYLLLFSIHLNNNSEKFKKVWHIDMGTYIANFVENAQSKEARYDSLGKWKETRAFLTKEQLPFNLDSIPHKKMRKAALISISKVEKSGVAYFRIQTETPVAEFVSFTSTIWEQLLE